MADATLPQTKYAQKLKAYEGELPSYIHAMDEHASRAGLTIRHLRDRHCIVSVYSGTREQIGRSDLSQYGEEFINWPSGTMVPSKLCLHKLSPSPCRFPSIGSIFKINEERYAIQIKECLPRAISTVGEGIECFDFNYYVAYVGEKDKLIFWGITGADMFAGDDGKEKTAPNASGYHLVLEETTRLHGWKWAYLKYPQHIQKAEEAKRNLSSHMTPEEYRQHLLKAVNLACTFVDLAPVETKAGQIYTIDAESKETIEEAWRDLYWTLHDAVVQTRTVQPKLTLIRNEHAIPTRVVQAKLTLIGNQDALH
jgi:hypothetical protein